MSKSSLIAAGLSILGAGVMAASLQMHVANSNRNKAISNQIQTEISNTGISNTEFKQISEKAAYMSTDAQRSAYLQSKLDSMKTKGVIDEAYQKGAQMVRDSVNKVKTLGVEDFYKSAKKVVK